ncbi:MAG TPA: glycosyltransferase family 39 protein [Candidatus Paceibacterota bacterium]|nr:glycosyltransferase family 39 protein [Candidatus Paceibacterota bacterium]
MPKRTRIWLLAGILIIATFLRFYHFTTTPPGLYPDEAMDGNNAAEVVQTGHPQVFYVEDNGREGLYVNLVAAVLEVYPVYEPWVIRLPAAVAGVLTVLGLYLLVAELFGYEVGLLAAFLLATSFWHINFSRIGFRAILAPLFLTWAAYLLAKAFRSRRRVSDTLLPIAAGVVYALGFYTYIAYRVTPLLLLLFIPFFRKTPHFWKKVAVFAVVTFLVAAPIGWYFVQHPADFFGRTSQISVTNSPTPIQDLAVNIAKTAGMFNFHGDENWRQNVAGAPELFWPVGILFLLGIALCLYQLLPWKKDERFLFSLSNFGIWFTIAWFLLAGLPAVISDEGIPHALRSILMLPPALIFAAIGGVWFYRAMKRTSKTFARSIAILFLVLVAAFAYVDYFIVWAMNQNVPGAFNADYVTIGNEINALPTGLPKYVVVNAGGVPVRGLPTPVETTMFITDTFTTSTQVAKNIHYLLPDQAGSIPAGTPSSTIFYIN